MSVAEKELFEGRTLKDAIDRACETLGISIQDIEYTLHPTNGKVRPEVVGIYAWAQNQQHGANQSTVEEFLEGLFNRLDKPFPYEIQFQEEAVHVHITNPDRNSAAIQPLVDAIQHLTIKSLNQRGIGTRVHFEVETFRTTEEPSLKRVARVLCQKVQELGCIITLRPLNAYDRRIVHLEVSDFKQLASRSIGDGANKRIQIYKLDS